ncbi:branched-chain amino acid ABC transporter permease [Leucobacter chromiiresistens]|uniref:alpha-amylase n=1 Tax=Leucobacter chromiiresistens TaxID=1079994 RepID=A0A1H1A616_9MICO|nr:branched-chain amino acid ABC transporter permease [Leucobacter chromiiresistens]SDQ35107.1 amino acid/amide ABC transporter membrane protein 1, HAAT family [Leucobacter chromiiresistens]
MNPTLHRRRVPIRGILMLVIVALLAIFAAAFSAAPAHAAEACEPDPSTGCVQGVIKLSSGEPAPGIAVTLSGAGAESTTETDEAGRWVFSATEAGAYTVAVDEETLPDGQFFKSAGEREVDVELHSTASALFPLTDDPEAATTTPETGGDTTETKPASSASSGDSFSWPRFWQQFVSGIRMGLLIALASLGLSLVFGTTGLSNFAQGEMVTMGGLLAAAFMGVTGNLWLAGLCAVIACAGFGWVQDKVLWKPLRKRRLSLMQLMIVSIGLSITLQYTFQFFFGSGVVRIDTSTAATLTIAGVTLTVQSYIAMGVSLLAIIAVGLGLMYTRFGRATRAISDNPALARASGIDVDRVINIVWIVGGGLAGLAGVFFGLIFNGLNWFTGGTMLLMFFAAVTLGGLGTAFGAFVGSMIIGMIVELTNIWLPGDLKYASALLLLILILLVRPQGIFGRKERIG